MTTAIKKTGLVGYPVDHSLSPAMHNAVYEYYEIDWTYQLYPCESNAEFHQLFAQLLEPSNGFAGLNVTMPYKAEVAQAILVAGGKLLGTAKAVQAANLVSLVANSADKHQPLGYNVDGDGLVASLLHRADIDLQDAKVLIGGTGAVTAVTCLALAKAQVSAITIASRHRSRVNDFVNRIQGSIAALQPNLSIKAVSYDEQTAIQAETRRADLIIDATPIGMYPDDLALLPIQDIQAHQTVLDVVYGHGETQLIKAARAAGAKALDGFGMLVEQAALTFETWVADQKLAVQLNHEKTIDIMNRAALAELQRRALRG